MLKGLLGLQSTHENFLILKSHLEISHFSLFRILQIKPNGKNGKRGFAQLSTSTQFKNAIFCFSSNLVFPSTLASQGEREASPCQVVDQ